MWKVSRAAAVVGVLYFVLSASQLVVAQSGEEPGRPWMDASLSPEQRADLLIARMTLRQKVQQISNDVRPAMEKANRPDGCGFAPSGRHIQGIPELGIPTVRMTNGSIGIIGGDCRPNPVGTGVPSTVAVAATFSPELSRQLGDILGDEARVHGHQVLLGPTVNPIRHPYGGRNYQTYSEDPYLAGLMGAETIKGIQAHGIHAVAKHYAGNEQETSRRVGDSVIPPRALHEIYLLPFEMAVRDAQASSIMCSYNRLNGVSACSNAELLDGTLRQRWGFGGYVMTDRSALHDLAPSIKAGVDWELAHRTPVHYALDAQPDRPDNAASEGIRAALAAGSITEGDIDRMLRRRYVQMFKLGHFDTDFDVLFEATPDFFLHGSMAREIAQQAIVLLKNENNVLPLNIANLQSVALIGAPWYAGVAKLPVRGGDDNTPFNEAGNPPYSVTPQEGLQNTLRALGSVATVTYESGGGTGKPSDITSAVELAKKSDVVIVMVGDDPSEGCDLQSLRLPMVPPADLDFCAWNEVKPGEYTLRAPERGTGTDQEALMQALTADTTVAQKMVVVLKTQGMVLMPWLDKVPALLEAWYPGQEDGNVVADVLFGLHNPSGKLPVTFGASEREAAYATTAQFPGVWGPPPSWSDDEALSPQYSEGLQVGYRWYEANNVKPVFPFGFGLSYTTFAYSGLSVQFGPPASCSAVPPAPDWVCVNGNWVPLDGPPPFGASVPTSTSEVLTVTYTITNTGARQGAEASQVYVTLPAAAGQPAKRLVGFKKVDLLPGASETVTITVNPSASNHPLSYWVPQNDAAVPGWASGEWQTAPGDYIVHVGTSSADTPLVQTVTLAPGAPTPPVTPGTPGTPPSSPATCSTEPPASDWRCVDGTWLQPVGDPANRDVPAPSMPATCATDQPGEGWACVNGRWLPPAVTPGTAGPVPPSTTPPLLTISSTHVAGVRDSLTRGETQFTSALMALEADANRALNVVPMSVMDKEVTPPSGDKHDYMSQAPYWWPDPSKPDGRPYIRRDGERNPEIERITDRENLERLDRTVTVLALAFHFTGRPEYAQHAARLLRVWFLDPATRMNPHLRFGQGIPGINEGRSAGIIETRFLPRILIDAVSLLQGSNAWTAADDQGLKDWSRAYLTWLQESPLGREQARRGNNQETWADVQIVALALYTGQTEVARTVLEGARADIADEFLPDGRQPRELARTRSWDYSIFDLTAFMYLALFGDRVGVDLWNYTTADGRSLRKGVEYLIPFATREKRWPHEQIGEIRPSTLHQVLRLAAIGFKEPRYRELAFRIGGETPRLELTLP